MKTNRMLAVAVIVMASMGNPLTSSAQDINTTPNVSVQATAKREVVPDELTLSIRINEKDYKSKVKLEEKQKDMIAVLKRLGINYEDELSIFQTGSRVNYKLFSRTMKPRSQANYHLILHDAATMQRVIRELEAKEISNIQLIETRFTKIDELKNELNLEAVKKAQIEARTLAQGVNQEIGKALAISSWMSNPTQPRIYMMQAKNAVFESEESSVADADEVPSISKLTYTVNVSVKFELK